LKGYLNCVVEEWLTGSGLYQVWSWSGMENGVEVSTNH